MDTKRFHIANNDRDWVESRWTRPAQVGLYKWVSAAPAKPAGPQCQSDRRWLVGNISAAQQVSYRPLIETPALFKTFAHMERTEESFLTFVDRFGQLGTRELASIGTQVFSGESLTRFLLEHQALRQVVGMLEALNRRAGLRAYAEGLSRTIPAADRPIGQALKTGDYRELKDACLNWIQVTVNVRLNNWTDVGDAVVTVLGRDASGKLRLQQATRSLVGILWLQCARAAEGDQLFRQCRVCRVWMLIAPGVGKNRQAIYCSDRCKMRAFRKNQPRGRRRSVAVAPKRGTK